MNATGLHVNLDMPKGSRGADRETIKLEALSVKVDHLVWLCIAAQDAATDFKEAVESVAEEAGLKTAIVTAFIWAKAGEKFEDRKAKALQLALVFEECE